MLPSVDIIIMNCNGKQFLVSCLTSLYKNTDYAFNLVIIDNASTDGSKEWLEKEQPKLLNATIHYNLKRDGGFASGVNTGLKYCESKYVLLLNNDTLIFQRDWLAKMVLKLEENPKNAVAGPKLVYPNGIIQHAGVSYGHNLHYDFMMPYHIGRRYPRDTPELCVVREVPAVTFACALIRRDLLKDGLDEAYPWCWEDTDFCCKIQKQGFKIWYLGDVELYHYEGASSLKTPELNERLKISFELFTSRWSKWLLEEMRSKPELYDSVVPIKHE